MVLRILLAASSLVLLASPAAAHLDPAEHGSFAAGFTHPLFGLDHVLAMIAVGLWAALSGGRALWLFPSAFVGAMVIGFVLAIAGMPLPFVEPLILASVVLFGAAVCLALKIPNAVSVALIGIFGICHGHAHGGEIGSAGEISYAAGFVLATAILHGAGLLIAQGAFAAARNNPAVARRVIRALGAITAVSGVYLAVAG
ncbi:urease accessory protein [Roseibium hamelinense]|uniref:Urease accessory protein n=1 Tax=Roseibium hamelinense TaxID=150831 RepID=A0A562T330_9HYPH|nr:HupE/UreJ family protein [Roseibium hamelinense]MTI42295.1 HupE/UreJ family protein [Roseibium hamelinense]TWI87684.1 urease accessory protein [Roseibium hamelinense]